MHPVHQAGSAVLATHALHRIVCSCWLSSDQLHTIIEALSSGHEGPHAALNTPVRKGRQVCSSIVRSQHTVNPLSDARRPPRNR